MPRSSSAAPLPPLEQYLRAFAENLSAPSSFDVSSIETLHAGFGSSLHRRALSPEPDVPAFLYAALRLPDCIERVERVLVGASDDSFAAAGHPNVRSWIPVQSRARRRRFLHDGAGTLAAYVSSASDLDDLVPSLCAFQIEWNKLHRRLAASPLSPALAAGSLPTNPAGDSIRRALRLDRPDWNLLLRVWNQDWNRAFAALAARPMALRVERLPIEPSHFDSFAEGWWDSVARHFDLDSDRDRPLFLVSSNTHGLANLVSGFAAESEPRILAFLRESNPENLWPLWLETLRDPDANRSNLLYYALRLLLDRFPDLAADRIRRELAVGVRRFVPKSYPVVEAQLFDLDRIDPARLDPRLSWPRSFPLPRPRILNMDYPLGLAAGHMLDQAFRRLPNLRGLFVLGKSAAAIGRLGDILAPSRVFDARTSASFSFPNALGARQVSPFLNRIAVFEDQKSVTVRGTFLHGRDLVEPLFRDDFSAMEMEAAPFLSALHRRFSGGAAVPGTSVDLSLPPGFAFGMLHYTSDTPYNVRPSLLASRLGPAGLEAAYASCLAILQRIFDLASRPPR